MISLTNLLNYGSFENEGWTAGANCTLTYDTSIKKYGNYSLKVTSTAGSSTESYFSTNNPTMVAGHIYYARCEMYQTVAGASSGMQCYWPQAEPNMGSSTYDSSKINTWQIQSFRAVRSNWSGAQNFRFDVEGIKSPNFVYLDGAMLIDLTATFGSGSEPSKEWCDVNIPFFMGSGSIDAGGVYIINPVGSATMTLPDKLRKGDILRFNITNSSTSNPYTGTIMSYTFPVDCTVKINAYGARGAYGNLYTYGVSSTSRSGNGAYVYGTFEFKKGDQIMILIGQHGKDAMTSTSSTKDQTAGAGGGGTFIVKRMTDGTGDTFVGSSVNGSNTTFSGWKVSPLIIAAGGNGTPDNGYSGKGTIYGGKVATGSAPTYAAYAGGGYSGAYGTTSSNSSSYSYGLSFLYGGLGSRYYYTRTTYAMAGFGGGGSNVDDGAGGGGGGYYGGLRGSRSATSYNAGTDTGGTDDYNAGDGYALFEILKVKSLPFQIKVNSAIKEVSEGYVKINGVWLPLTEGYGKTSSGWVGS